MALEEERGSDGQIPVLSDLAVERGYPPSAPLGTGQLQIDRVSQEQSVDKAPLPKPSPTHSSTSGTSEIQALIAETQLDIYIVCALGGQVMTLHELNPLRKNSRDSIRQIWKTLDKFKRELLSWAFLLISITAQILIPAAMLATKNGQQWGSDTMTVCPGVSDMGLKCWNSGVWQATLSTEGMCDAAGEGFSWSRGMNRKWVKAAGAFFMICLYGTMNLFMFGHLNKPTRNIPPNEADLYSRLLLSGHLRYPWLLAVGALANILTKFFLIPAVTWFVFSQANDILSIIVNSMALSFLAEIDNTLMPITEQEVAELLSHDHEPIAPDYTAFVRRSCCWTAWYYVTYVLLLLGYAGFLFFPIGIGICV